MKEYGSYIKRYVKLNENMGIPTASYALTGGIEHAISAYWKTVSLDHHIAKPEDVVRGARQLTAHLKEDYPQLNVTFAKVLETLYLQAYQDINARAYNPMNKPPKLTKEEALIPKCVNKRNFILYVQKRYPWVAENVVLRELSYTNVHRLTNGRDVSNVEDLKGHPLILWLTDPWKTKLQGEKYF